MPTFAAIKLFLGTIPPWAYKAIGGALVVIGLLLFHHHLVHKHDMKIIAAEDARLVTRINAVTARIRTLETKAANIERDAHEKEVTRIDNLTADIIVRGPGKAQCSSGPATASPGRSQPSGGPADAPVDRVSDQGGIALIALPFNDAVRLAGQCDINRDENLKWRENRQKLEEINGNFPHGN